MSGEWTVETLRQYFDQRLTEQREFFQQRLTDADKAIQAALTSAEKAVTKAEAASERRFEAVNEFRAALADQQRTLLPRVEYDAAHAALVERVNIAAAQVASLELRLTSRLDLGEGTDRGTAESRSERRLDLGSNLTAVSVLIGFLILAVALYAALKH